MMSSLLNSLLLKALIVAIYLIINFLYMVVFCCPLDRSPALLFLNSFLSNFIINNNFSLKLILLLLRLRLLYNARPWNRRI
ncbi:uncharacterized protein K441DRAFT_224886 [Cenococcum geophilum 1.58]|uniref:uncharacterized protein n=1 Tax=Cenococcum geophilum 1.58 TaxID=794803 RepID=UPI00358E0256|nr:hypothetical protein K441DRAFT_224886 [Cenococcum geophilum 1.58]